MIDEEHQVEGMQSSSVDADAIGPSGENQDGSANSSDTVNDTPSVSLDDFELPADMAAEEATASSSVSDADSAKLTALEGELQSVKAQLEERTGQYMRIVADFDNFRKRTQREKEELEQQIKCSTINRRYCGVEVSS